MNRWETPIFISLCLQIYLTSKDKQDTVQASFAYTVSFYLKA